LLVMVQTSLLPYRDPRVNSAMNADDGLTIVCFPSFT
jgi:hypothetical protein